MVVYFGVFSGGRRRTVMLEWQMTTTTSNSNERAGHKMGSGQGFTLCTLYMLFAADLTR